MANEGRFFRQVVYALTQGVQNMLRSPFMSLVVISTMMVALSTLGFILLVLSDLNHVSDELATQLKIVVFLEDQQDLDKMAADIEKVPEVVPPVVKVTREQALDTMTKDMPDLKEVLKDKNPFPASIEVTVSHIDKMDEVGTSIKGMPGVEDVQYNQELAESIHQVQGGVQLVGAVFAAILILATLAIIINTIQLAVHYRHSEIEIMRLVGAPVWFIRLPFLLEGLIFGVFSALVAALLLFFWRLVPYMQLRRWLVFLPLPDSLMPLAVISGVLLLTGVLMGLFGSALSVRRYLQLEFSDL